MVCACAANDWFDGGERTGAQARPARTGGFLRPGFCCTARHRDIVLGRQAGRQAAKIVVLDRLDHACTQGR